jgi:hypothetical protein
MSDFAQEIARLLEANSERLIREGVPGSAIIGQLRPGVLPPPASSPDVPYAAPLTVQEVDGSPSVDGVAVLQLPNGTLSSLGGGVVRYTPAAGSSTHWFDVTAYGAVGDGSTDDTTAIGNAIAALDLVGRGVLYFPPGRYKTSGGFTLSSPTLVLGGGAESFDGAEIISRVITTSSTAHLFTVAAKYGRVQDIALVCTAATPTAGSLVRVTSSYIHQQVSYQHVVFRGAYDLVAVDVGAHWEAHDSYFLGPVRYGIHINNTVNPDAGDWLIAGCWFNPEGRNATAAVRLDGSGGGKIAGCKFNCDASGTYKFTDMISMSAPGATSILIVDGCSFENYSGDAIDLTGPNWDMVLITGCQFGQYSNTTGNAIKVSTLNDIVVTGCHFRCPSGATPAISLTSVNRAYIGACTNNGFTAVLSQSSCTAVIDLSGGAGGVSSVGLSLPAIFSVSGSPVTSSGTLTATLASQSAHRVFAGPASGSAAAPTFRQLAAGELSTRWEPVTNGSPSSPEVLFDAGGDIIMAEV